ncbi:MAG: disulfide oxidoreductase [Patescibacteria group bacterium]|nr:MAG: disulfide oxidoreductase [Patescibacteria group bacterium]
MKKNNNEIKINKEYNLAELVYKYPQTEEVLMDYGLHCAGCIASSFDTIEAGAKVHGMTDEEIEEMLERVNEVINFNE